jgi:undecaprenyl-diphosphatase
MIACDIECGSPLTLVEVNVSIWRVIFLGVLQGFTEFLPVSSSGHLVIMPYLFGWEDTGLALNVMLHLGTLAAIVAYFFGDLWRLVLAALQSLQRRTLVDPYARLAWMLAIATLPGALIGFFLEDFFEQLFGMPVAAAGFLFGTSLLLVLSEYLGSRQRPMTTLAWGEAIVIGFAQALAILPGLSRSGTTISAGLMLGLRREDATRFSFLLAVPIVLGSGLYQVVKLVAGGTGALTTSVPVLLVGMVAAGLSGYVAIAGLLAYVRRHSLIPFAIYTAALATLVLVLALTGAL